MPADRAYDVAGDLWVRMEGDLARLGMTDVAQTRMGKMVSILLKRPGRRVRAGGSVATVESAKWVGPIHSPFDGEIIEPNYEAFDLDVLVANRDPYDVGWITLMRPDDAGKPHRPLLEATAAVAAYRERIDELDISCFRCVD
jgi:glycine cleavage system H protein